ncbi:MAG: pyruvate kinase [Alphaproteobacteria bacterium]|nr:pyruvate kinase [Alphaproteobacteria bacterium]
MNSSKNRSKTTKRQTKIIATLGPSSSTYEEIENIFLAGADVFRLNFSHATYPEHQQRYDYIRQIEEKHNTPICVFADMQGPKIRVGTFKNQCELLQVGQEFTFDLKDEEGDNTRVKLPHPEIIKAVEVDTCLLVDDGNIRLKVKSKSDTHLLTEVIVGGKISDKKGVNIPETIIPVNALTEKDKKDLEYALNMGVDWVALSFVQTKQDVEYAKEIIKGRAPIISKIEKPSALTHLDEIIEVSDGIMLARGDLGVEIPAENVPVVQKKVITKARKAGKPVIVATQMLESMTERPVPTRAEATDVATAVYDGADAVMLSAETASGNFPTDAVQMMQKIAKRVETDSLYMQEQKEHCLTPDHSRADAIAFAAYQTTVGLNSSVVATFTVSGFTTLRIARERPPVPIISVTTDAKVARKLMLVYGVQSFIFDKVDSFKKMEEEALKIVKRYKYAEEGENVVITASYPVEDTGETNMMHIVNI